ncbi:metallopeptidase family protein [Acidobacteriota bacterium]
MKKEQFELLVEEALEQIPKEFTKLLDNITVMVQDRAPQDVHRQTGISRHNLILGIYHGVPLKHRGPYYGNTPPDVITLYQKSIEDVCKSEDDIKEKIKEVVLHEVGHYFGLKEKELKDIEGR